MLKVAKFGGSSVADKDRVMNVASIVADTYKKGNDVVVVVSAVNKTTDDLIGLSNEESSYQSHAPHLFVFWRTLYAGLFAC